MTEPRVAVTGIGEVYGATRLHVFAWRRDAAPEQRLTTTWAISKSDRPMPERRTARLNYHVDDPDRLIAKLEVDGIAIEKRQDEPYDRFAWIHDPERNKIELYQELIAQD